MATAVSVLTVSDTSTTTAPAIVAPIIGIRSSIATSTASPAAKGTPAIFIATNCTVPAIRAMASAPAT